MSFLLNKLKGYAFGKNGNRNQDIIHLFFVDDLKLFATSMSSAKTLLDLVTTFSQDTGIKFGECLFNNRTWKAKMCDGNTRNERNQDPTDKRKDDIQVFRC